MASEWWAKACEKFGPWRLRNRFSSVEKLSKRRVARGRGGRGRANTLKAWPKVVGGNSSLVPQLPIVPIGWTYQMAGAHAHLAHGTAAKPVGLRCSVSATCTQLLDPSASHEAVYHTARVNPGA
jgi:hypothetical protein